MVNDNEVMHVDAQRTLSAPAFLLGLLAPGELIASSIRVLHSQSIDDFPGMDRVGVWVYI